MNVSYREIQYFRASFYAILIGSSVVCGAVAMVRLFTTGVSGFVVLFAGLGLLLLALVAALGRLVVTVDGDRLTISHGWLGLLQKTFDLAKIDEVRVRFLSPVATYLAWGWRWGSEGAICYTARVRRGVELGVGNHRVIISSLNPQTLKEALRPGEVAADDRPEYRRVELNMARRRRTPVHQNWGILDPQKMRAMSA
ncbi:MAG: hypothetical protein IIB58_08750 [Planctomycetes bacterium]|nr:hypothetical protein [Planctomycetota bacterium]